MTSGVAVKDECQQAFETIKLKHSFSYIIYRISDDKKNIVIEEIGDLTKDYDDFRNKMLEAQTNGQCRYAVYDMKYETSNGQQREKLVFFHWSPDSCKIGEKMLYASSLKALKAKLTGIPVEIQANDDDDLKLSEVLEKCMDRYV